MINSRKTISLGKRGFTLIETLVAILILALAITGPLTIANRGLDAAFVARDQIVAAYLAQDAIEYVRFVRDTDKLSGSSWLTNLGSCVPQSGIAGCYLDSTSQYPATPTSCGSTCPVLYYNSSSNLYQYTSSGTSPSIFTRTVTIQTPVGGNSDEATVTATVTWIDVGQVTHSVSVTEDIFNWQ